MLSAVDVYLRCQKYLPKSSKNEKNTLRKKAKHFKVKNDILYYISSKDVSGKPLYRQVLTSKEKQQTVIQQCHVINGTDGHFGVKKTISAVQTRFYWKGLVEDVKKFIKVCDPT